MSKISSPGKSIQTTNMKTAKIKNKNQFSFADSRKSVHAEKWNVARALYQETQEKRGKLGADSLYRNDDGRKNLSNYLRDSSIFKENMDNRQRIHNIYSKINSSGITLEEVQAIKNDHRIQVEKLLLEVSRLHDVIYELQFTKKAEISRLKEEYQHLAYLQINNIKQSQQSQILILQNQIKAVRNSLDSKQDQNQQLHKLLQKQRSSHKSQIETLQLDLKSLVQKKNNQLFKIKEENEATIQKLNSKNQSDLEDVQQICDKELKKLYRLVEEKEKTLEKLSEKSNQYEQKNQKLMNQIEQEKDLLQQKMKQLIDKSNAKYDSLQRHINDMMNQQESKHDEELVLNQNLYQAQINNLLLVIRTKDKQIQKLHAYIEANSAYSKISESSQRDQIASLKEILEKQKKRNMREIEQLKIKMGVLHENDVKQLVNLYEAKIDALSNQNLSLQNQNSRIHKFMHEESHRWYENKKKYQIKISKLNNEIMGLKAGLGDMERTMTERIQNQRSALLITSQNMIRDAQIKNSNVKFYEDQLRKLRALMQTQAQNHAKIESQIRQAYNVIENENKSLVARNKQLLAEHNQMESQFYEVLNQKQAQIRKLNDLTHDILQKDQGTDNDEIKHLQQNIEKLKSQILGKQNKIKQLEFKIYSLQKKLAQYKSQNQQLFLENQIGQEQVKTEYSKVAEANSAELKKFYQRKIEELESDKKQLMIRNSAEAENVAELVRRYNQLQKNMGLMIQQAKKRTELQEKIMHLGMDANLVANKAKIFCEE